tara:strand:- start:309 stop:542 length:234 start_codon:yes stop_codon:yes gene_type:complete
MNIYEKRGRWCYNDSAGNIHKFVTEAAARKAAGICECKDCKCDPCECVVSPVSKSLDQVNAQFSGTLKSLGDNHEEA